MNRDIKFRAYDNKNKEWLLGYEYESLGGFSLVGEIIMMGEWSKVFWDFISNENKDFNDLKVMQYTGLKDKNDKEIYEGDILEHDYLGTGEVKWDKIQTGWYVYVDASDEGCLHLSNPEDGSMEYEIIGNIYD